MSANLIQLVREGEQARLRLNRPEKRNALTREMLAAAGEAVDELLSDPVPRLLILEAEGPVFCAGMDLGQMQERARSDRAAEEYQEDSRVYCELVKRIWKAPFPTVAAVRGAAVAGGMGLVLACDFVICGQSAFFALPEPQRGITASMVTPLLSFRVSGAAATGLLLSGERCDADGARRLGFVYDVVPDDQVAERTAVLAAKIQQGSPAALRITKEHLHRCTGADVERLLEQSLEISAAARETDDAREGLAAFLEKRSPAWQDSSS